MFTYDQRGNVKTTGAWTGNDKLEHNLKGLFRHELPRSYQLQLELADTISDELLDVIIGELRDLESKISEYEKRFLFIRQEAEV